MRNKNHEGYYDPTACRAVMRVMREQKRKRKRLTYQIGDVAKILSGGGGHDK